MDSFAPLEKGDDGRYRIPQDNAMPFRVSSNPDCNPDFPRAQIGVPATAMAPGYERPSQLPQVMSIRTSAPLSAPLMQQRSDALRGKLLSVGERFVGFDKVMEEETLRRRMLEEQRIAEIVDGVQNLERGVNNEIRRRVESNKSLQGMTERFANEMLDDLQRKMLNRMERLTCAVESLQMRCQTLEKGILQFKGELPSKLQMDTAALVNAITDLSTQMETNKKDRLERDQDFVRRVGEVEFKLDQKADNSFVSFDGEFSQLSQIIESVGQKNEADEEEFRAFILEELETLKNGLILAGQARERTDDEIVVAINQYTTALQKGLRKVM